MELYEVTEAYVSYLRKFEPKKILSNADQKNTRKFIGLIVKKGKYNYVVPLSSPKYGKDFAINGYTGDKLPADYSTKKYKKDICLLKDTTEPVVFMYSKDTDGIDFYSKIQCNNMIPVPESELIKVDVNAESDVASSLDHAIQGDTLIAPYHKSDNGQESTANSSMVFINTPERLEITILQRKNGCLMGQLLCMAVLRN